MISMFISSKILLRNAINEEWSQRCVDQHSIVQLSWIGGHVNSLHLLETAQRMALGNQFGNWPLVQCASDQQNDVVNHVAVGDEVQECRQWLDGMVAQVLELNHQLLAQFVVDDRNRQRRWLIGQELTVIGALQMQFQI